MRWRHRRDIAGRLHRAWIKVIGTGGSAGALDEVVRGERALERAVRHALDAPLPAYLRDRVAAFGRQLRDDISRLQQWRALVDHGVAPSPTELPPVPGDPMPRFSAPASTGQTLDSERFRGKVGIALFFVPDLAARSIRRIASFNRRLRRFDNLRVQVVGVAPAVPAQLRKLSDDEGFVLPLLADPDGSIRRSFSHPGEFATVTVTADGRIDRRYVPALGRRHVDRVLADLRG